LVVFTAAQKQYAAEAFDLDVVDYLVKPVSPERFFQAIFKVRGRLKGMVTGEDEHLFIRDSTILRRLRLDDILLAEARGDYVKVYTRQQTYCIHVRFGVVERRLPRARFIRVHRSFIVALDKIDHFQDGGVFIEDRFVPVTETYRKALSNRILVI
jgi:DNA-binding LytR/AlgR family response regulator